MKGKLNTHHPNKWTMILLGTLGVLAAVFLVKNYDDFFPERLIVVDTQINANQFFVDEHLGIEINSPQNLGSTQIKYERKTAEVDEQQLILYSSEDGRQTWNPHIGTKRDLDSNKFSLKNVQNGAMWTATTST